MFTRLRNIVLTILLFEIAILIPMFVAHHLGLPIKGIFGKLLFDDTSDFHELSTFIEEQKILKLATVEQTITQEAVSSSIRKAGLFGPIGYKEIEIKARGYVKAGFDLEHLPGGFVKIFRSENGQEIIITLPAPQITDVNLEIDKSDITRITQQGIAPGNEFDFTLFLRKIKSQFKIKAENSGILESAKANAVKIVMDLARIGGFETEEIKVRFADEADLEPASDR